jgi:hypothetical protein
MKNPNANRNSNRRAQAVTIACTDDIVHREVRLLRAYIAGAAVIASTLPILSLFV